MTQVDGWSPNRAPPPTSGEPAARALAAYAVGLRYDDLPEIVRRRATDCLIDTVAAAVYGAELPWSRIVRAQATGPGPCALLGTNAPATTAEAAALANAVAAHAAELDSLCHPGAGVHPGAVLAPAALAVAQERGASGRDLLAAIVAGAEVLIRIGRATRHSAETRGFHAPGLTGPFGAAVAAGKLLGLDRERMTHALAVAGSLGGGLLEFANGREGGMVKRLHIGRAAQSGVLAARLAADGFTGPASVLEGRFGFLAAYCAETDVAALTDGLGKRYELLSLCLKRYPCHITAHTPITAVAALRAAHGFAPEDVRTVTVAGSAKMAQLHGAQDPQDLIMALYSIPFCVAVALARDAAEPDSFGEDALRDPTVRALCARIRVVDGGTKGWTTTTRIALADGRVLERPVDRFPGMPDEPLAPHQLADKVRPLTRRLGAAAEPLLTRLEGIAGERDLAWLLAAPAPAGSGRPAMEDRT